MFFVLVFPPKFIHKVSVKEDTLENGNILLFNVYYRPPTQNIGLYDHDKRILF